MFDSDYWAHEGTVSMPRDCSRDEMLAEFIPKGTVSMSESTRTLKEGEPGIYWVRQHGADDVFVRKWTGRRWELVDNQRVYWTDWSFWLIVSGPLLSESDFMQREDVKRWKRIEEAAKEAVAEGRARGHYDSVQLFKDGIKGRAPKGAALIDLLFPPAPFTPPPKPELRLWRDNHGHVKWAASKPLDVNEDVYVEHWYEIDSTGQPIGERNS